MDLEGLRKGSCECYGTIEAQYDRMLSLGNIEH